MKKYFFLFNSEAHLTFYNYTESFKVIFLISFLRTKKNICVLNHLLLAEEDK